MKHVLFLLFPILIGIFSVHYFLVGQAVYGDGIYYWSYVRSIYIDRDFVLGDEINHHYDHVYNNIQTKRINFKESQQEIALDYHLPIGPAIGWLPFFTAGDLIGRLMHIFNQSQVLNGYADIYQISVGIGNIFYVVMGLYFVFLLLKQYFNKSIATIATLILFFTTNLLYYGSWDVINSHPLSFFLSSLLAYFFFVRLSNKWYQWIFLGGLVGGLIITRTQEIIFGIVPLVGIIHYWQNSKRTILKRFFDITLFCFLIALGIICILLPQVLLFAYIYHGIFNSPYLLSGSFSFLRPHIFGVLLNNNTGLLFTSPSVVIGAFGLFLLARQRKIIGIIGLIVFLAEYYVIASWISWDQAASYGIRMLITTYPLVAVGIASIVEKASQKFSLKMVYLIGLFLFLFNIAMIVRFHVYIKTPTRDAAHITRIDAQKKLNTLLHTNFQFFKN